MVKAAAEEKADEPDADEIVLVADGTEDEGTRSHPFNSRGWPPWAGCSLTLSVLELQKSYIQKMVGSS